MNSLKIIIIVLFLLVPFLCSADAGVPVIAITYPSLVVLLIPVIITEYYIIRSLITGYNKQVLTGTVISNVISTFLGVPLAWGLLLLVEIITTGGSAVKGTGAMHYIGSVVLQAAWLIPYEDHLFWMVPVAIMINLIPAYYLSKYSEYFIMTKILKETGKAEIKKAVFRANNITYLLLAVFTVVYLIYNIIIFR